jgi:hypothetical protein
MGGIDSPLASVSYQQATEVILPWLTIPPIPAIEWKFIELSDETDL